MKCKCADCADQVRLPLRRTLFVLLAACAVSLVLRGAPLSRLLLASEDAERHRLLAENEERIQYSERFLNDYRSSLTSASPARPVGADPGADVGLTVLTMARGRRMSRRVTYRTQYLTQSLVRLLQLLNDTSLTRSYRLSVCDVDDRPHEFREARELEDLAHFFKRYGSGGKRTLKTSDKHSKAVWEKLKHDYVYCLLQTMSLGVRYALLVEDDAVAHVQLLPVLEHVLKTVLEAPGARPVTYVKLFHPERLLGYISVEVERLAELASLSVVVGALLTLACSRSRCSARDESGPSSNNRQLLTSWIGWTLVVAVVALAVGRVNLIELRRLSPQLYQVTPTPSCCTPAMLYTQGGARAISQHLLNVTCTSRKSTDFWIDEFRRTSGERALLVQPNLFTHIGMVSSLRTTEVNPLSVQ
nr:hypothetical protein BaRGS_017553 [Batillaria attramentaria]